VWLSEPSYLHSATIFHQSRLLTPVVITSQQQSDRPELTADRSTARQQQIRFVPAPFTLRFALLPAFSF
jgi:hypothetical protein